MGRSAVDLTVPMCEGCDCVRVSVGHQVVRSGTSEAAFRGFNEDYTHTHTFSVCLGLKRTQK